MPFFGFVSVTLTSRRRSVILVEIGLLTSKGFTSYFQYLERPMPIKSSKNAQWFQDISPFVYVESMAEVHLAELSTPHLRLLHPLTSRNTLNRKVSVDGDHKEVQTTFEFVGSNGAKYIVDAILQVTKIDQTDEKIMTMRTQIFASWNDPLPSSTDQRTLISRYVKGAPELRCRWDEFYVTCVDGSGVHRSPVSRIKTFL
jgi:hypothetical protein